MCKLGFFTVQVQQGRTGDKGRLEKVKVKQLGRLVSVVKLGKANFTKAESKDGE